MRNSALVVVGVPFWKLQICVTPPHPLDPPEARGAVIVSKRLFRIPQVCQQPSVFLTDLHFLTEIQK